MTDTNAPEMQELLPCPFCGGNSRMQENGRQPDHLYFECCCDGPCDFVGPAFAWAEEAIQHWNTRTPDFHAENIRLREEAQANSLVLLNSLRESDRLREEVALSEKYNIEKDAQLFRAEEERDRLRQDLINERKTVIALKYAEIENKQLKQDIARLFSELSIHDEAELQLCALGISEHCRAIIAKHSKQGDAP